MILIIIKIIVYNVYVLFKVSQVKLFHVDIEHLFLLFEVKRTNQIHKAFKFFKGIVGLRVSLVLIVLKVLNQWFLINQFLIGSADLKEFTDF